MPGLEGWAAKVGQAAGQLWRNNGHRERVKYPTIKVKILQTVTKTRWTPTIAIQMPPKKFYLGK